MSPQFWRWVSLAELAVLIVLAASLLAAMIDGIAP